MRSASRAVTLLAVCLLVLPILAIAQSSSTSVHGTVYDANHAVVSGATLTLSNAATGFSRTAKSDGQGNYQFSDLPPATYEIDAIAAGFSTVKMTGVQLLVNTPATVDVHVEVAAATVTLEVAGTAPLVNTVNATLGHAFDATQIQDLPFEGRDPSGILSLQPGVAYTGNSQHINQDSDSRSGAVNGARSDQTNITLDGIDNNNQVSGYAFQGAVRVPLDSLQEFKVTTASADADSGRSSGGQVSLVSKSGSNSLHGGAYIYNRSGIGEANDWFAENAQVQAGLPNKAPHLVRNTFGAYAGGPIIKNRMFIFGAFEGQRLRQDLQVTRIVPSDGLRNGSITYQACPNITVNGKLVGDPGCTGKAGNPRDTISPTIIQTLDINALQQMDLNCFGLQTCPYAASNPNHGGGPDPAVLAIFNQYPRANTDSVGDGFNFRGFTFSSPLPGKLDAYVLKLDYNLTQNGNHRLFVRGAIDGDRTANQSDVTSISGDGGSQFPGLPANRTTVNNSKTISVGYTATLSSTLINDFRYGYVRFGQEILGDQTQHFINFRGLDNPTAETPTTHTGVPVQNFVDDLTKIRGNHTLQFGADFREINDIRTSNSTSYFFATTNAFWLAGSGIANLGGSLDPAQFGPGPASCDPTNAVACYPAVWADFSTNYDFPMTAMAGLVSQVNSNYNLNKSLTALPEGQPIPRHFRNHEYEFYGQDSWRLRKNLTMTYGLRWTLLQPPYETTGTQVSPTISLNDWFQKRSQQMTQGQTFDPPISFNLSGQANGKAPFWAWNYHNIAPRLAFAYSPDGDSGFSRKLFGGPGKTSIRVGYGMYYDHFGEGLVNTFDRQGSFGLTTTIQNTAGIQGIDTSARLTGLNTIPTVSAATFAGCSGPTCPIVEPPPSGSFPVTPPNAFAITWGLNDKLQTPYSHVFNLSINRDLGSNFVLEAAYVGRFAHHLLQEEDIAMPLNLVDTKSGMDYFTAVRQLGAQYRAGTPITQVQPIPYWENLFPGAAGPTSSQIGATLFGAGTACLDGTGNPGSNGLPPNVTATQAMYDLFCTYKGNETTGLEFADFPGIFSNTCYPACSVSNGGNGFAYYSPQYSSLYGWWSNGNSGYNALQVSLRRRMIHGLEFDLNYTYSRSIDAGSDAERVNQFEGAGLGQVINSFSPKQLQGPSDFNNTHQFNANWVWELPFGHGKRFAPGLSRVANGVVGGWTLSGLWRWSSGYPFSVGSGFGWATNFEEQSNSILNGKKPVTGSFRPNPQTTDTCLAPNVPASVYQHPCSAISQFRQAFPGESGQRNNLVGPGTFNIDMALAKSFNITESKALKFTWETFNVSNTPRFDVATMQFNGNSALATSSNFGTFSSTLSQYRVMEFSGRFIF